VHDGEKRGKLKLTIGEIICNYYLPVESTLWLKRDHKITARNCVNDLHDGEKRGKLKLTMGEI
jgi:hypothetical protein